MISCASLVSHPVRVLRPVRVTERRGFAGSEATYIAIEKHVGLGSHTIDSSDPCSMTKRAQAATLHVAAARWGCMASSAPTAEQLLAQTEWLTRLARALVGDAAADDVVQETYAVALAKPPKREGPLRPWLGGVARNVARMAARGRTRRERREQAVPLGDEAPTPEQLVMRAQMHQKVGRLVLVPGDRHA